jgi:CRISPR-associated endonuclease/helicase Cas3
MPKTTLHLSANMCGEHRSDCIEKIKTALKKEEPIRVVSTQLVEAGVDIDFPIVFRAMAGFDSIAQAAGRCNREGNLNNRGQVFVFEPPKPAPVGTLRKGESAGRSILTTDPEGCKNLLPETFRRYFESYFADLNSFDKQDMESLLVTNANPDLNFQFRSAARRFNMIENKRQLSVVVLYKRKRKEIEKMVNDLRYAGPNRELMRKLQRFIVSIPENIFFEVKDSFEDINGIWCQMADTLYDNDLGFVGYNSDLPIIY